MERMLDVVRHRCAQIFKYTAELQAEVCHFLPQNMTLRRNKLQEGSESEVEESEHPDEHEDELSSRPFSECETERERQSVSKPSAQRWWTTRTGRNGRRLPPLGVWNERERDSQP